MNNQKPEPYRELDNSHQLDLHSVFLTIQGEGPFSGERAVFVRLAGCNLQCPGCDTEYTNGRRLVPITYLIAEVMACVPQHRDHLVVITGGEPLRQPIGELVRQLILKTFRVQIESNGSCPPDPRLAGQLNTWTQDRLCLVVSPKTKKIHPLSYQMASVFKYVVQAGSVGEDGLPLFALEHVAGNGVARPRPNAPVYVTPFDDPERPECNGANIKQVVQSCMDHGYIAGLQIHKLLRLP